jgi:hypothetical protein
MTITNRPFGPADTIADSSPFAIATATSDRRSAGGFRSHSNSDRVPRFAMSNCFCHSPRGYLLASEKAGAQAKCVEVGGIGEGAVLCTYGKYPRTSLDVFERGSVVIELNADDRVRSLSCQDATTKGSGYRSKIVGLCRVFRWDARRGGLHRFPIPTEAYSIHPKTAEVSSIN